MWTQDDIARLPQDLLIDPARLPTPNEAANEFADRMRNIVQQTRDHLRHAQDRQAEYYNSGRRTQEFHTGDQVLVEIPYLQTPEERARDKDKLKFKRSGPYPSRKNSALMPTDYNCRHQYVHIMSSTSLPLLHTTQIPSMDEYLRL